MIQSFRDQQTEDVFDGRTNKKAAKILPLDLWVVAGRKLDQLNHATELGTMAKPPGNQLEPLKGDRKGQHSIRINDKYRICFRWADDGAHDVEITDYH
ncbi:MAG: type II toxin-antitoxin system RelE/ParE family toxin [Gemmatimonadales bacterium]